MKRHILSCEGRDFTASGKQVISEGYRVYENSLRDYFKAKPDASETDGADGESEAEQNLPELTEGMEICVSNCGISEHFTKPPKRYSDSPNSNAELLDKFWSKIGNLVFIIL